MRAARTIARRPFVRGRDRRRSGAAAALQPAHAGAGGRTATRPAGFTFPTAPWRLPIATTGACAYVATVGIPSTWDVPLLVLVACAALATLRKGTTLAPLPPLTLPVLLVLGATALSVALSRDASQSLRLAAPLLPGALLFFLVADRSESPRHAIALYLTFVLVALALAVRLLWTAWTDGMVSPNVWAQHAGTPLIVVGNDVTLLAFAAPLALAVVFTRPHRVIRAACALSVLLSVAAIVAFRSRGALVALIVSLGAASLLIRPRLAIRGVPVALLLAGIVDASLGFPLLGKFSQGLAALGARVSLWSDAWAAFIESPWLGHGPYTVVYVAERESVRWAHNLYLDVAVGQGLLGFAALTFLLGAAFTHGLSTHRRETGEARLVNAAAVAALAGFCVAAMYELSLLRIGAVLVLFMLLGVISRCSGIAPSEAS